MLTELQCKQVKPKDKVYTLSDGRGLMLAIYPNGSKYWILRLRVNKKEKRTSLGLYPDIPLKTARDKAYEYKKNLADVAAPKSPLFADIAEEWLQIRIIPDKVKTYIESIEQRLRNHILPAIGSKALNEITPAVVLDMCRGIEARGIIETAVRCKQIVGQIYKYGIATDRAEIDPTYALRGALKTRKEKHFAALTDPVKIRILMKQIHEYPFAIVRCALLLSAYTFCRPGEIRHAEWVEINGAEWRIPAEKMKMKRVHIVPLSAQAMRVLEE